MKKYKIMSRAIKILEKYSPDLTVKEVMVLIEKERELILSKEKDLIQSIKNNFRNVYLKVFKNDGLFGEEFILLHVSEIISHEKSMDWENLFHVKGRKITFTKGHIFSNNLIGEQSNDLFSEKKLMEMKKISKDDFDFYLDKFNVINNTINNLLIEEEV